MTSGVTVVDYGMGNLFSVERALEHCGAEVYMARTPKAVAQAERLLLPGVGAFADGMRELARLGLVEPIHEFAASGKPFLGICLGMQMLLDESNEFGTTTGLGLIPGRVIPVPAVAADGHPQKIPHIGWNALVFPHGRENWNGTLLQDVEPGEAVYFVHSFMASPTNPGHRIADCLYGRMPVSAAIGRENVQGCQFHPEKSGEVGLRVLKSFLEA